MELRGTSSVSQGTNSHESGEGGENSPHKMNANKMIYREKKSVQIAVGEATMLIKDNALD